MRGANTANNDYGEMPDAILVKSAENRNMAEIAGQQLSIPKAGSSAIRVARLGISGTRQPVAANRVHGCCEFPIRGWCQIISFRHTTLIRASFKTISTLVTGRPR